MQVSPAFRVVVLSLVASAAAALCFSASASAADEIAFTCIPAGNVSDLCLVNPDEAVQPTNLTNTLNSEIYPAWSPDGTRLAYSWNLPGQFADIFVIDVANPETTINVSDTNIPGAERTENTDPIVWSPGGTRVAYTSTPNSSGQPEKTEIYVSPADGTAPPFAVGSSTQGENDPTYSPDGTKIAFERGSQNVVAANANGGDAGSTVAAGYGPVWSPDGTRIMTGISSNQIRISRVDGMGAPVILGPSMLASVNDWEWSPDSSKVLWANNDGINIQSSNGTGSPIVITSPGPFFGQGAWSPDGTRIAFIGRDISNTTTSIYIARADGSGTPRPITTTGYLPQSPVWKPTGTSPPVDPPVDPPGGGTRTPVTISLADFRKPSLNGNHHVLLAGVSCPGSGCSYGTTVTTTAPARPGRKVVAKKAKKIVFAQGTTTLASGEEGEIEIPITKAGRKLLKPGKKLKLKVTIEQHVGTDPVVTTDKTLKLKVPKKKGKK